MISRDAYILTNQHVVQQCGTDEIIDDKNRTLRAALEVADTAKLENTGIASRGAAVTVRVRRIRNAVPAASITTSQ